MLSDDSMSRNPRVRIGSEARILIGVVPILLLSMVAMACTPRFLPSNTLATYRPDSSAPLTPQQAYRGNAYTKGTPTPTPSNETGVLPLSEFGPEAELTSDVPTPLGESQEPTNAPNATSTPVPTQSSDPTQSPPGETPNPSPTSRPTKTPVPTSQPEPTNTSGPEPTNTSEPEPTNTPKPTSTPTTVPPSTPTDSPPPTEAPTPTDEPATCPVSGSSSFETTLLNLINKEREKQGAGPLTMVSSLRTAARKHSKDMACNDFFAHRGSDGSSPFDRMLAEGYSFSAAAENIYAGSGPYNSPQSAFNAWMNSSGHRTNMLNPIYTDVGIGYKYNPESTYGGYFTADFARP